MFNAFSFLELRHIYSDRDQERERGAHHVSTFQTVLDLYFHFF